MAIRGGSAGKFWTSPVLARDPKRAYRFRVQFGNSEFLWYAKSVTKPTITITESSHQYLNHTYYWPAKTEWNEVDVTLIDPVEPDLAGDLIATIQDAGFVIPAGANNPSDFSTPSKRGFVDATGTVIFEQIDSDGVMLEQWTLNNAWIKEVTFGDLDYGSEDLTEVTVKFRYDWASFSSRDSGGSVKNAFTV